MACVPELACKTVLHVLEIDQEIMVDLYTKKVLCVHCVEERRGEERRGTLSNSVCISNSSSLPTSVERFCFYSNNIYSFLHWKYYTFRYSILISTPTTPGSPPPYIGTCPLFTDSCRFRVLPTDSLRIVRSVSNKNLQEFSPLLK